MMNTEQEPNSKESRPESVTLKKGTLWQQRDKFFSRWKERFFILTSDYLACFKKASKIGISEMGGFLYKVCLFSTFISDSLISILIVFVLFHYSIKNKH